jgi:hypothetical protein
MEDGWSVAERMAAVNEVRMRGRIKAPTAPAGRAAGCADQPAGAADGAKGRKERPIMEQGANGADGVSGLPFGKSFATLDDFLEHPVRDAGPIDQPWYRELRPGAQELVTARVPAGEPLIFTREQRMRGCGLTRKPSRRAA